MTEDGRITYRNAEEIGLDRVAAFYDSLTVEHDGLQLPKDMVLGADMLLAAVKDDEIVGLYGVRKVAWTPMPFNVVASKFQRQGYGTGLRRYGAEQAATRFHFQATVADKTNLASIRSSKYPGVRKCLFQLRYQFRYRSFDWIGDLLFPIFYIGFPFFYLIRKQLIIWVAKLRNKPAVWG